MLIATDIQRNIIFQLWKKVKEKATHLHYFPTFEALELKVHESLIQFENTPKEVLALFGMYYQLDQAACLALTCIFFLNTISNDQRDTIGAVATEL